MFSELEHWLERKNSGEILSNEFLRRVTATIQKLKALVKGTFDAYWKIVLTFPEGHWLGGVLGYQEEL